MHTVSSEAAAARLPEVVASPTDFIVRELAALAARCILEMPAMVQEGAAGAFSPEG